MKIEDVSMDVQFLMFENSSLSELCSLAETNQQYLELAQEIFARKHSKRMIAISEEKNIVDICSIRNEENEIEDVLFVSDLDTIFKVLNYFGHLIKNLMVTSNSAFSSAQMKNVTNLINLRCADQLTQLQISSGHLAFFEKMTKPFKNVETLIIKGGFNSLASSTLKFDELFPAIRRLSIGYIYIGDQDSLVAHLSNLEYMYVEGRQLNVPQFLKAVNLKKLLRKNRQISKLELSQTEQDILDDIRDILPDIDSLETLN